MKRLVSVLIALVSLIGVALAFTGCEDKQLAAKYDQLLEENRKLSEENSQLSANNENLWDSNNQLRENNEKLSDENKQLISANEKLNQENEYLIEEDRKPAIVKVKTIESGKFYTLKTMYDNGLLVKEDLKSIACRYYDFYKYEENPYSGLFNPQEEFSKETENKVKQAYLNQIVNNPEHSLEGVQITCYYGTYNGNVAVRIYSDYRDFDPGYIPPKTDIGGVVFEDFWSMDILVYHI